MSHFDWVEGFLNGLADAHVDVHEIENRNGNPNLRKLDIETADWSMVAKVALEHELRWAGLWGDHRDSHIAILALFERNGGYLMIHCDVSSKSPVLPSHTPWYPAADRMERHAQDLLGVAFLDHPDARRWTRHKAWGEGDYPLRNDYPLLGCRAGETTPADGDYCFQRAQGAGVYEIPVGPVHAGIIESGHFRFQAVGEYIIQLEQHLGYVHKGIEKLAVGRDPDGLARLASRVSGDSAVAHSWAACRALEIATATDIPERAVFLRALMAERERVTNHLGDIGGICSDVGFDFAHAHFSRLKEKWQRRCDEVFLHRFLMDCVVPGGVSRDIRVNQVREWLDDLIYFRRQTKIMMNIITENSSLIDRLTSTGRLLASTAQRWGCLGYVGRASGTTYDVRRDSPYAPYDQFRVEVPSSDIGDVAARLQIRTEEIYASLNMQEHLLENLPAGEFRTELKQPDAEAKGLGIVEGWRGEIISYVRLGADGKVARYFPRDPSWFNWPALEKAVLNNIVPDFPVCNRSVNGSHSGQDL